MEKELAKRIYITFNVLDGLSRKFAKSMNIKQNTLWLLYILYSQDKPCSQKQICKEWMFPITTVNTIVKECENEGLITLNTIGNEKKELNLILTEKGRELSKKIFDILYQFDIEAMKLTLTEYDASFVDAFESYVNNYKDIINRFYDKEV